MQGVGIIGRKFALRVRSESGSACDTIYAFETQRRSDEEVLLSSLFESIGSLHGGATATAMLPHQHDEQHQFPGRVDLEYEVQMQRTIALQAEKGRLEAELRALAAERECEILKRERAELHTEMAALAASMATELAAAKDGVNGDVAESVRAELSLLKRAIALIATRIPAQQRQPQPDGGHAAADTNASPDDENAKCREFLERAGRVDDDAVGTSTPGAGGSHAGSVETSALSRSSNLVQQLSSRIEQFASAHLPSGRRSSRFAVAQRHPTTASGRSVDSGLPASNFTTRR